MTEADLDGLIAALLRGERPSPPADAPAQEAFLDSARFHRVLPLLDARFRDWGGDDVWPAPIQVACLRAAIAQAAAATAHRSALEKLLDAMVREGIRPMLFKGTALAHGLYPDPAMRPGADSDLLVSEGDRAAAEAVLGQHGFVRLIAVAGERTVRQALWRREDGQGWRHDVDLHWRIKDSPLLPDAFDFAHVDARAVALPALGPAARAFCPVDGLLLACLHRAAHAIERVPTGVGIRRGSERLIWLYDIHLLARCLPDAGWDDLIRQAERLGVRAVLLSALREAHGRLGTAIPPRVEQALAAAGPAEPSVGLLASGRGRRLIAEVVAVPGWRARAVWIWQSAVPSADFIRGKYPDARDRWLPFLYARRFASFFRALLARRRT
jgi:hypothetical protein